MTNVKGKRVALIGGAGFIGHNLALELSRQGADVSVVDGLQVNNLLSLHGDTGAMAERSLYLSIINERLELLRAARIPLFVEDARDYQRLSLVLGNLKPDVIVLLAAVSHACFAAGHDFRDRGRRNDRRLGDTHRSRRAWRSCHDCSRSMLRRADLRLSDEGAYR